MNQPASKIPRALRVSQRLQAPCSRDRGWFRTQEGRRYGWELASIIVVKIVLLALLWLTVIAPYPKPATPAAMVAKHVYLQAVPAPRHD
jgi:hypothetical protein